MPSLTLPNRNLTIPLLLIAASAVLGAYLLASM
jgi:hypothetical protein